VLLPHMSGHIRGVVKGGLADTAAIRLDVCVCEVMPVHMRLVGHNLMANRTSVEAIGPTVVRIVAVRCDETILGSEERG